MRRLALSHARVSALEEGLFARVLDAGEVVLHGDKDEGVRGDVVPVAAAVESQVVHLHHHTYMHIYIYIYVTGDDEVMVSCLSHASGGIIPKKLKERKLSGTRPCVCVCVPD